MAEAEADSTAVAADSMVAAVTAAGMAVEATAGMAVGTVVGMAAMAGGTEVMAVGMVAGAAATVVGMAAVGGGDGPGASASASISAGPIPDITDIPTPIPIRTIIPTLRTLIPMALARMLRRAIQQAIRTLLLRRRLRVTFSTVHHLAHRQLLRTA